MIGKDTALLYLETDYTRFPVEPWNTYSALFLFSLMVYWLYRLWKQENRPLELISLVTFMAIGSFSSVIFHAYREFHFFFILDWLALYFFVFALVVYLWNRMTGSLIIALSFLALLLISENLTYYLYNCRFWECYNSTALNIAASLQGLSLLIPLSIACFRYKLINVGSFFSILIIFILAFAFKTLDGKILIVLLPMGTHFLWHLFSALGIHILFINLNKN